MKYNRWDIAGFIVGLVLPLTYILWWIYVFIVNIGSSINIPVGHLTYLQRIGIVIFLTFGLFCVVLSFIIAFTYLERKIWL